MASSDRRPTFSSRVSARCAGSSTVDAPGSPAGRPADGTHTVYHAGDLVYHQGSTWQALRYSQGTKPGDPSGAFEQLLTAQDGSAIWTPTRVFIAGDLAEYNGSTWKALWWTRNQRPGDVNGPWEEIKAAQDGTAIWTATRVFTAGDIVVYLPTGKKYVAQWYTRNQTPGQAYGPWKLTG